MIKHVYGIHFCITINIAIVFLKLLQIAWRDQHASEMWRTVLPSRKEVRRRSTGLTCTPFDSLLFLPLKDMTVVIWELHFYFSTGECLKSLLFFDLTAIWSMLVSKSFKYFFMAFIHKLARSCHPAWLLVSRSSTNLAFSEQRLS